MSYILDALRRADADRDRGTVPDIHARPAPPWPGDGSARRGVASATRWGMIVAAALAVFAVLWWAWDGRDAAPARGPATPTAAMPSPTVAPAPPADVPPAPIPSPEPRTTALPAPPSLSRAAPEPAAPSPTVPLPAAAVAAAAPVASAPGATPRVHTASELPEEVRRALPTLAIGGAIYSPSAANRMLIVNGQLLREGDAPARDVTIERILPKSAVLIFRGYRYEVKY